MGLVKPIHTLLVSVVGYKLLPFCVQYCAHHPGMLIVYPDPFERFTVKVQLLLSTIFVIHTPFCPVAPVAQATHHRFAVDQLLNAR